MIALTVCGCICIVAGLITRSFNKAVELKDKRLREAEITKREADIIRNEIDERKYTKLPVVDQKELICKTVREVVREVLSESMNEELIRQLVNERVTNQLAYERLNPQEQSNGVQG